MIRTLSVCVHEDRLPPNLQGVNVHVAEVENRRHKHATCLRDCPFVFLFDVLEVNVRVKLIQEDTQTGMHSRCCSKI